MAEAVPLNQVGLEENGKIDKEGAGGNIQFEDVLEDVGGFGFFQRIFAFVAMFPQMTAAMIILSPVFTGSNTVPIYCKDEWRASDDICMSNLNCTEIMLFDDDPVLTSIVQEWDLVCGRNWIVEAVNSCQMAGMMTGAMVSSVISDNFGRNRGFIFVALCMGIFGIIPSLAFDPFTYALTRFLAGLGMGGCFVVFLVHLMEYLTPSWRTLCGCVSLWPFGEMLLGLLAYYVPNWRHLTALSATPIFFILAFYPFIQESPRWLLTRKRTKEAHDVICKLAKWNGRPAPPYSTMEKLQVVILREEADVLKGLEGVKQILQNRHLRIQLAILCWANVTCSVIYYAVSFSASSLSGNIYLNFLYMGILDFWALPAVLIFSNWLGRRKTFMIYMTLSSLFLVSILVLALTVGLSQLSTPMIVMMLALGGRFCVLASWGSLTCIILEAFPTTMRSSCLGLTTLAGYLGGIAAPQIVLLGKEYAQVVNGNIFFEISVWETLPYIVYSFLTISSASLGWFLFEMRGVPLKDTIS